jgi:hypothetical protein
VPAFELSDSLTRRKAQFSTVWVLAGQALPSRARTGQSS